MQIERMSIKTLRRELKTWGLYWRGQEYGGGYGSRSACDKLGEIRIESTEQPVPDHVHQYDQQVEQLSNDCRRALRVRYICTKNWALVGFDSEKSYQYWLRRAEGELLALSYPKHLTASLEI
ncbi:hypothetical protein [Shewanella surugensis]|uniref:Uncharacterized protein n=1 Tax=Shewanella surugensis TaxID=212020 RepID=A0ABT0L8X5_9GAMM|nr:hypothetical protein [Shewanella surugensis]MCL1124136.1 hypothetical protein [Shewanella surugensis]